MSTKKNILVYPLHPTSYAKLIDLAVKMSREGLFDIDVLVTNEYVRESLSKEEQVGRAGFGIVDIGHAGNARMNNITKKMKWFFVMFERVLVFLKVRLQINLIDGWLEWRFLRQHANRFQLISRLMDAKRYHGVLVTGDRHMQYEPALLKACKIRNIPTFIPPISLILNPREKAKLRYRQYGLSTETCLQKKYPKQFFEIQHGQYIGFYETWKIRALGRLKMLSNNPWVLGAGLSDYIMVSGKMERDELIEWGLREDKIIETGDPEYDALYLCQVRKSDVLNALIQEYGLSGAKKNIVIALQPLYEHKLANEEEHWKVINEICSITCTLKSNVLVSLHPKMHREQYHFLEQEFGLKIIRKKLREFLPLGDIFISGQGSTTWRWSALCGIPTIICDWYGLNYIMNQQGFGMQTVNTVSDFKETLTKVFFSAEYATLLKQRQLEVAHRIGILDGKATQRIIANIASHI